MAQIIKAAGINVSRNEKNMGRGEELDLFCNCLKLCLKASTKVADMLSGKLGVEIKKCEGQ